MNDIKNQQKPDLALPEEDIELLNKLKATLTDEVDAIARRYREEGHPPLLRFAEAGASGEWQWHEKDHFRQPCHSCQKTLAMQWELSCPNDSILQDCLATPFHFREAVQIHLKTCDECRGRLRKLKLGTAVAFSSADLIHDVFRTVSPAIGAGSLLWAGLHNADRNQHFEFEVESADGSLIVTLRENYHGNLQARITSPDRSNAGRRVRLAIRLANGEVKEPLEPIVLLDAGKHGSLKECEIGPFENLAPRMTAFKVQAEWEE